MVIITNQDLNQDRSADQIANDEYRTPPPLVKALFRALILKEYKMNTPGCPQLLLTMNKINPMVLDVGAGSGVWGQVVRGIIPGATIAGVEIQDKPAPEGYDLWFKCDFRDFAQQPTAGFYDLVIGNPPYSKTQGKKVKDLAEMFIRLSLGLLNDNGWLVFMLKSTFRHGVGRANGLWREHPPVAVFDCVRRVSFYESAQGSKTNDVDFSIFVWRKHRNRAQTFHQTYLFNWDEDGNAIVQAY